MKTIFVIFATFVHMHGAFALDCAKEFNKSSELSNSALYWLGLAYEHSNDSIISEQEGDKGKAVELIDESLRFIEKSEKRFNESRELFLRVMELCQGDFVRDAQLLILVIDQKLNVVESLKDYLNKQSKFLSNN